jgi:hypothetical protein
MAFVVPVTWKLYATSNDGMSKTYTRPGHTVKEPRLAIVSRVVASFGQKQASWTTPSYRVRVFNGVLDGEGNPDPTRTIADLTLRSSLNSNGAEQGDEVVADLLVIVDQPDFANAAFHTQEFPEVATA